MTPEINLLSYLRRRKVAPNDWFRETPVGPDVQAAPVQPPAPMQMPVVSFDKPDKGGGIASLAAALTQFGLGRLKPSKSGGASPMSTGQARVGSIGMTGVPPLQFMRRGGTLKKALELALVGEEGPELAIKDGNKTHVVPLMPGEAAGLPEALARRLGIIRSPGDMAVPLGGRFPARQMPIEDEYAYDPPGTDRREEMARDIMGRNPLGRGADIGPLSRFPEGYELGQPDTYGPGMVPKLAPALRARRAVTIPLPEALSPNPPAPPGNVVPPPVVTPEGSAPPLKIEGVTVAKERPGRLRSFFDTALRSARQVALSGGDLPQIAGAFLGGGAYGAASPEGAYEDWQKGQMGEVKQIQAARGAEALKRRMGEAQVGKVEAEVADLRDRPERERAKVMADLAKEDRVRSEVERHNREMEKHQGMTAEDARKRAEETARHNRRMEEIGVMQADATQGRFNAEFGRKSADDQYGDTVEAQKRDYTNQVTRWKSAERAVGELRKAIEDAQKAADKVNNPPPVTVGGKVYDPSPEDVARYRAEFERLNAKADRLGASVRQRYGDFVDDDDLAYPTVLKPEPQMPAPPARSTYTPQPRGRVTPPISEEDFVKEAKAKLGASFDESRARAAWRQRYGR